MFYGKGINIFFCSVESTISILGFVLDLSTVVYMSRQIHIYRKQQKNRRDRGNMGIITYSAVQVDKIR